MSEFWVISAPGDKTPQQTYERLQKATMGSGQNLSNCYKFSIPELKVGTLDSLIGLTDDLGKLDTFCEGVCRKVASYMGEVLEDQKDKLSSNLSAGEGTLVNFMHRFQWNMAKYPTKQPIKSLTEILSKVVTQVDTDLRSKSQAYNNLKSSLQNMERKATGSLLLRNLSQIVKKDDFIDGSEYLRTVIVAVPVALFGEWEKNYESLADYVAPKSSRLLTQDEEYGLFATSIFKKVYEEFKYNCSRYKFFVREFNFNEQDSVVRQDQINKIASEKRKMLGPLLRWLKVNFSEVFTAWIHIKALRVFVESVLRYGLPVNFQAVVLDPPKKNRKRLRDVLNNLYCKLDSTGLTNVDAEDSVPGLSLGMQEYYPYVFYKVILDFESRSF
uniref:V-type proton ATPase subunit C 2 n=1 Tax=Ascidia sydneiensis samea TaxID=79730 RepID=VATC_ASCSS|nr:RecName: Full=V-type proton ATPase subunit C 2; Short=V-ATPase subunit C 2; AltName: Full=Vacuolar proton pump subunit C 2 [Ascidia sydneiensis samea]BAA96746.1 vacuolar-type H+-ATPase subunit C [Ascidia sydneiensis samea]